MIDFDLIKRSVTAEEAASAYGLDVSEHHKARCPWHKDSHPSLSFKGGYCYCFTCHRGGSCIDLTMQIFGVDAATAARTIAQDFAISGAVNDTPLSEAEQRRIEEERAYKDALKAAQALDAEREKNQFNALADTLHGAEAALQEYSTPTDETWDNPAFRAALTAQADSEMRIEGFKDMEQKLPPKEKKADSPTDEQRLKALIGAAESWTETELPEKLDEIQNLLLLIGDAKQVNSAERLLLHAQPLAAAHDKIKLWMKSIRKMIKARTQQPDEDKDAGFPKKAYGEKAQIKDFEEVLDKLGWSIRYNEISHRQSVTGFCDNWTYSRHSALNTMPIVLRETMRSNGLDVTKEEVIDALSVIADKRRFNPVLEMLHTVNWDGVDRLQAIYEILGIDGNDFYQLLTRKWLIQCVAMALNDEDFPYGADGALVLSGAQGIGKTQFFSRIALSDENRDFFAGGKHIDMDVKDSLVDATGHWIVELGELDSTLKKEQASLKAFITLEEDEIRRPYARAADTLPRRTSFCATVNGEGFLCDDTGNRRWWVIPVKRIDLDRLFGLTVEWRKQLWGQAYTLFKADKQGFRLNDAERDILNGQNAEHERALPAENEIRDIIAELQSHGERCVLRWMTVSQFIEKHSDELKKYNAVQVGKALDKLGYAQQKKRNGRYRELPTLLPDKDEHGASWYSQNWNKKSDDE